MSVSQRPSATTRRTDRLLRERIHNPYKARSKGAGIRFCPACKAVSSQGRWTWSFFHPDEADEILCEACARIRDGCPAGQIVVRGLFAWSHRAEILNLIWHTAKAEETNHPLNRIMSVKSTDGTITILTTDIHSPRRIGEALRRAHRGTLEVSFEPNGCFCRVNWSRDN